MRKKKEHRLQTLGIRTDISKNSADRKRVKGNMMMTL